MRRLKVKTAFTLVELLVVISIIAILLSVLMPCLSKARQQGRQAVCGSNIRQLFLANSGYAIENKGCYVLAAEDMLGKNLHRWHGVRTNVNTAFDPLKGPLKAYLADGQVKRCPAFKENNYLTASGQSLNFEAGCGGYGYNDEYVGGRSDVYGTCGGAAYSAKNSDIRTSAQTVMFADTAYRQQLKKNVNVFIEYSFAHPPYWVWYLQTMGETATNTDLAANAEQIGGRPDPVIHFRHGRFANVCWSDGHVTKETMELSASYITHAIMTESETVEMSLGWFGPDNNSLFDLK